MTRDKSTRGLELWEPQEGEWCWYGNHLVQLKPSDDKKYPWISDGDEWYEVLVGDLEPFIGDLPSFIKDKR